MTTIPTQEWQRRYNIGLSITLAVTAAIALATAAGVI